MRARNPTTEEAGVAGSRVPGQPDLQRRPWSRNPNKNITAKEASVSQNELCIKKLQQSNNRNKLTIKKSYTETKD